MHGNRHARWPRLDRAVQHGTVDVQQIVDMFAAGFQSGDLLGIAQIGDVDLIDLQVSAAGGAEELYRVLRLR